MLKRGLAAFFPHTNSLTHTPGQMSITGAQYSQTANLTNCIFIQVYEDAAPIYLN